MIDSHPTSDKKRRVVSGAFYLYFTMDGEQYRIWIDSNYEFELSAPRFPFRVLFVLAGPYYAGEERSLLHDRLYFRCGQLEQRTEESWERVTFSRWTSDRVFTDVTVKDEVGQDPRWLQWILRLGVIVAGWWKWYNFDQKIKQYLYGSN